MANTATEQALRLLTQERDRLDRAIAALSAEAVEAPRRGRPPGKASATTTTKAPGKRRGRPPMSDAEKAAASERMKKYWAKRRRATNRAGK